MYRKLIKKVVTFLIVFALAFPKGVPSAYAANATTLYIKDTKGGNTETIVQDTEDAENGWSWVSETATLTLDGFDGEYIEADGDINIILKGSNTITLPATPTEDSVCGIKTTLGNININGDGEEGSDSLAITQTELARSDVYVLGMDANVSVNVTDCDIVINIAGADEQNDYNCYSRTGINASSGSLYFNGSASLDIDMAETSTTYGSGRGIHLNTTGNIDINIYDAYTEDSNVGRDICALGGLIITKSGNVNISAINGEAVYGPLVIGENSGTFTFKGAIKCGSAENSYLQYKSLVSLAPNKKVIVTGNEQAKTGIVYKSFTMSDYGCYLITESGEKVLDGSIQTVSPNPLSFTDCSEIDLGEMIVGNPYASSCFHGLVSGGSGEYSFSIDPNYPLPEGLNLQTSSYDNIFYARIKGTPTAVCEAGTIRIIVTDSEEATAYIDMSYGDIIDPPKYIDIDGEQVVTTENASGTNWVYEGATKTITLDGYDAGPIESEETLNVVLKGNNTITMPATPEEGSVYGIISKGEVNIEGDEEAGEDSLTIIQTGFTKKDIYITGIDALSDIKVTDCKIVINIAGADVENDYDSYGRYGLSPHTGSTYVNGTGSLDIDISETSRGTFGIVRGLNLNTTGNIDINIYDSYTEDSNVGENLEGIGGLNVTKSGTVNISVPNGNAISGPLKIKENAGTINFKGAILCGSSETTYLYYPGEINIAPNKKIIITDNAEAKSGIVYKEFSVRDYGCYLINEVGEKVTDGSIQTASPNELSFTDISVLDFGNMTIDTQYKGNYFHGLVSGGSGDYTFSIDEEYPLPEGLQLNQNNNGIGTTAFIGGTPTTESEPGKIRVVVTDSEGSTAYIDIAYGTISVANPITSVTLNKENTILVVGAEETLSYVIEPQDASITTVSWSSNNEEVAYVNSSGKITANKVGKATITVTTTQGKFKDTCEVIVKENTPNAVVYGDYIDLLEDNTDYAINGLPYVSDNYGRIPIDNEWRETTVNIIKVNADTDCNSNAQQLYIPSKLAVDISTLSSSASIEYNEVVYDGTEKEPTLTIEGLEENTDFTVEYESNINAGTATVIITGIGDYFGVFEKYFTIKPIDMTGIVVNNYVGTYDKMGHTFTISGVPQDAEVLYSLIEDGVYSASKPIRSEIGLTKVYFKISAQNYKPYFGSATIEVRPISINEEDVVISTSSYVYDGKAKEPIVTVDGLVKDVDYTISYINNINAGNATVVVTGIGIYGGKINKTFSISAKEIVPTIVFDKTSFTYNGAEQKPVVTVKDGTTVLKDVDYTVSYPAGMINAGTYKVTVTLKGNYKGSASATYTIIPAKIKPVVKLAKTKYVYNGKTQKPSVTVKNGSTVLNKTDYTVTYAKGCKNVGSYKVTVTLKGNYSGTASKSFVINPKATTVSKLTAGKKKLTVTWKKLTGQTTGYEVQYGTSKTFKGAKKVVIKKNKTTKTVIKKLKSKKTYYVRIRTYKTVKVNGKSTKLYSSWSKAKSTKVK
ncbi:MAG: Ig-like domain-containing protein [Lachnospiraceae bacterium]|nr:Ig-like domain-containing protein [Lachnospiraceae bacterium]